ncbi:MAG: glycosyltransferase, partial [Ignavibacteria bacterium]
SIEKASVNYFKEIFIVDNASDDGSVELIKEKFPDIKLIVNSVNVGFGRANNQAMKLASGKYIMLINPDTIVSENTIDKMKGFFEKNPETGLAGCKILNPDGSLQLACRRSFPGPWTSFCKVTGLSSLFPNSKIFASYNLTYLDENESYEVDALSGSFMMMKKEVYEKVGGFDEDFFMYGEDLDLSYRIKKAGYKVYYVHETQIIHYKGESTNRSSIDETKEFYRAMHLFVKKHLSGPFLVEAILRSAIGIRRTLAYIGKIKLAIIAALLDFIFFNICLFVAAEFYIQYSGWSGFQSEHLIIIYTVPAFIHIIIGTLTGLYRRESLSVLRNFLVVFISFFTLSSLTFFFKEFAYSRALVIIDYMLLLFLTVSWRIFLKSFFKIGVQQNDVSKSRTLIVGTNEQAINVAEKLKFKRTDIRSIIGLIGLSLADIGKTIGSFNVVGSTENIIKVIKEFDVTEIIFCSEALDYGKMMTIVAQCQSESVDFKISGSDLNFVVGKTAVSMLDEIPLIGVHYNISKPLMKVIKRLFDLILGLFVLFFIYPFIYFFSKLNKKETEFRAFIKGIPSVVFGKRSFVGPKSSSTDGFVFFGRQGLTGFWYVENNTETEKEKLDFYYAKNQNIWLDLEILGRSLNKMWSKKG